MIVLFLFEGPLLRPLSLSRIKFLELYLFGQIIIECYSNNQTEIKSLLITIQQKRSALTISALIFQIRGRPIEQVDHAKLLGVMIECSMSWEHQIDTICRIISSRLSLLRRIKPYSALILPYNSIILVSTTTSTAPTISATSPSSSESCCAYTP